MKDLITSSIRDYFEARHADAGLFEGENPLSIQLDNPRDRSHGDLACNVAMASSKKLGMPPRALAEELVTWCNEKMEGRATAEVAGPGFINFRLAADEVHAALASILKLGADYGRSDAGGGEKINLEFVSANPTGPAVVVSARAAAFGSTLARLLEFSGHAVTSEYFLNDAGGQVRTLGASLLARWKETQGEPLVIPENGYHGLYLKEMAESLRAEQVEPWLALSDSEAVEAFARHAIHNLVGQVRVQMDAFRTPFDVWFSEKSLHDTGKLEDALAYLEEKQLTYEKDGAVWFKTSDYGDEKDRVVLKSDGVAAYLLADVAYALDKFGRGFDKAIYVLGPDHHSHAARLKAVAEAIGAGKDWLEVILLQWVTLVENGETVAMSKRAGEFVTMEDLVNDVGVDVARTYFLTRRAESHLDFDLGLAREQSSKSPIFYAQYATARIAGVLRKAEEGGLAAAADADLSLLSAPEELALIRELERFPELIAASAKAREPNRLFQFLNEVATLFHRFYHEHQIVSEDAAQSTARLALCRATRQVLGNGLDLMGVSAPERM
ncbi:arginine--tRNA ligase [bacterium]|nr:arginine--tRNA ligase [bacterium]